MITIKYVLFELKWIKRWLSYLEKTKDNEIWIKTLENNIRDLEKRLLDELKDKEIK